MQYIEQEMSKKKEKDDEPTTSGYEAKIKALYQLPDRLKFQSQSKKTEEMLSNQMLSGIPEVDLGVEWADAGINQSMLNISCHCDFK